MCEQKPYTRYGFRAGEKNYPVKCKRNLRKGASLNLPSNAVNLWIIN